MKYAGGLSGLGFLLLFTMTALGEPRITVTGSLDWERMELNAAMSLDAGSAGIQLPTGRLQAEEILSQEFPGLLSPYILSIPVDSSSILEDLVRRGELSPRDLGTIAREARKTPPAFSGDLSRFSAAYSVDLRAVSSQMIRHRRAADIWQPLAPASAAAYTGIVIIANGELPIHGKHSQALLRPCLFPKVWDTEMNLIYERNVLDPAGGGKGLLVRYASQDSVFQSGPSGLSRELIQTVGTNPLRILARGVFGILPTDPIIDREDALIILSSPENRRLLREGRVAIVLHQSVLKNPLGSAE